MALWGIMAVWDTRLLVAVLRVLVGLLRMDLLGLLWGTMAVWDTRLLVAVLRLLLGLLRKIFRVRRPRWAH